MAVFFFSVLIPQNLTQVNRSVFDNQFDTVDKSYDLVI